MKEKGSEREASGRERETSDYVGHGLEWHFKRMEKWAEKDEILQ